MPLWMLLVGRLLYRVPVTPRAALGAACSLTGVAVVLSGGSLAQLLAVQLVPGDGWILLAALAYVAIFPSVLAYRFWGTGVARVGPAMASFFANLSPLFAALLSGALLGEWPLGYHALGFVCIVAGIAISTPRQPRG
jgi:drug/metabolite transporter (DMT)-like permease